MDAMPRKSATYENKDERFLIGPKNYKGQQYSNIYFCRLAQIRPSLKSKSEKIWPSIPVADILNLELEKDCILFGTIYKDMVLKPSILDEYTKDRSKIGFPLPVKLVTENDFLILEDEKGRVKLISDDEDAIKPSSLVTGVIAAVRGFAKKNGDFFVKEMIFPGIPRQISPLENYKMGSENDKKYILFVSGLNVGKSESERIHFQLLMDLICGDLYTKKFSSSIIRIIICGNCVEFENMQNIYTGQALASRERNNLVIPMKEFDVNLAELSSSICVDVMAGENDPSNFSLPQQPLNKCLFPHSRKFSNITFATNPHNFVIDDIEFLGTSGQNVNDLIRYSDADDALTQLERLLTWNHLAPTAPDTLSCFPYIDDDPFIIQNCPHVFFCANQKKYSTKLIRDDSGQKIRLICIPKFYSTNQAVLLELPTLNCSLVDISISDFQN